MKNKIDYKTKLLQNIYKLATREEFVEDAKKIRKKYNIPETSFKESSKEYKHFLDSANLGAFISEVNGLTGKYKITGQSTMQILNIILFNQLLPDKVFNPRPFEFCVVKDEVNNDCLAIKIFPETTMEDIRSNWKKIQTGVADFYGYNPLKQKREENLKRDFYLRSYYRQGAKKEDLVKVINKHLNKNTKIYSVDIHKLINKLENEGKKMLK